LSKAGDNDVLDLELFDRELHHRSAIQVGRHHHVGDVAMHKQLAGLQADDFIGGHTAVRAANP